MKDDILILKQIEEEIKKELQSNYLLHPVQEVKKKAEELIKKKQRQIQALENCIQRLEDLYE